MFFKKKVQKIEKNKILDTRLQNFTFKMQKISKNKESSIILAKQLSRLIKAHR